MNDISDSVNHLETDFEIVPSSSLTKQVLLWTWQICCAAWLGQGKEQTVMDCIGKGTRLDESPLIQICRVTAVT